MDNTTPPQQPPQGGQQPRPQPQSQPLPLPLFILPPMASTISSLHQNHPHFHLPFPPPTTPTSSSSSTTTHHKKRRSKLLHMDTITTTEPPLKTPKHSLSHNEVIPPCTECGKVFWSWKALFGHMRCHPERPWRGIKPPPSHLQHRALPLTPQPPPPPPMLPNPYTSDDHEVAASLLLLASGPDLLTSPPPQQPQPSPPSMRFECSSCKKTFGSHQALGGHRASHKNVKGCFAITKNITDVAEDDGHCMILHGNQNYEESVGLGLSLGLGSVTGSGLGSGSGHKCGICLKVFPTGQALGGHMRCQWEKNEEQHQQAQASSSTFGLGIGPVSRPSEAQCGLDLNLPAQLVDGGSSSSFAKDVQLDLRLRL